MVKLQLESEGTVINLNGIDENGKGVQVTSGVTGLGFPEPAIQWLEGAGDGAVFRAKRAQSRTIDLPLHFLADDRTELKELVRSFVTVADRECVLRFTDEENNTSWIANVVRSGGGDFIYGEDTRGTREFNTVVTFTAGDPFWRRDSSELIELTDSEFGDLTIDSLGDSPTPPKITVHGPGQNIILTGPRGDVTGWSGILVEEQSVTFDFERSTLLDDEGTERYFELSPGPQFWSLEGGESTINIEVDNYSDEFLERYGIPRRNFVKNPSFETNLNFWDLGDYDGDLYPEGYLVRVGGQSHQDGYSARTEPFTRESPERRMFLRTTIEGLTPGEPYRAFAWTRSNRLEGSGHLPEGFIRVHDLETEREHIVASAPKLVWRDWVQHQIEFIAQFETYRLAIAVGTRTPHKPGTRFWADRIYFGPPGYYRDGEYAGWAWEGDPHNSESYEIATLDTTQTRAEIEWTPRKQVML